MSVRAKYTIIPAQPGFYVLDASFEDESPEPKVYRHEVVAWLVDIAERDNASSGLPDCVARPVCVVELTNWQGGVQVLTPEGRVEDFSGSWDSIDAWIESEKREHAQRAAR